MLLQPLRWENLNVFLITTTTDSSDNARIRQPG